MKDLSLLAIVIVFCFAAGLSASQAGTQTLDFNFAERGTVRQVTQGQFSIRGRSGDFYHTQGSQGFFPVNGTPYISQPGFTGPVDIVASERLFSVLRIDVAEYSTNYAEPQTFVLEGEKGDGSIVQQTFVTDGVMDGSDPAEDFETFELGVIFRDLRRLAILRGFNNAVAFDNVVCELGHLLPPLAPKSPEWTTPPVVGFRQVKLFWYGVADRYVVERAGGSEPGWLVMAELRAEASSFVDESAQPETSYTYRIFAINEAGSSEAAMVTIETASPSNPPVIKAINFDPPQELGAIPLVGSGVDRFSSVVFGTPTVQPDFMGMSRALVFSENPFYEQVMVTMPKAAFPGYRIAFDVATKDFEGSDYQFLLLLDLPESRTFSLHPGFNEFWVIQPGYLPGIHPFQDGQIYRVVIEIDFINVRWKIFINGSLRLDNVFYANEIRSLRFSLSPRLARDVAVADPNARVAIDNFSVRGFDPSTARTPVVSPDVIPGDVEFPSSPGINPPPRIKAPAKLVLDSSRKRGRVDIRVESRTPIRTLEVTCRRGRAVVKGSNPYRVIFSRLRDRATIARVVTVDAEGMRARQSIRVIRR